MGVASILTALVSAEPAVAGDPAAANTPATTGWDAFAEERRAECVGPSGKLPAPIELSAGGHRYRLEGHRLVEIGDRDADDVLRVGVISALKDDRAETKDAVRALVDRLLARKIDVLVANGDLATNEFEMESTFAALAARDILVVALIGNTESCGSFNRAANDVFKKRPSFINGNWVRRLELDDGTILSLPGYYDRRFTHTGGAARYDEKDLEALRDLASDAPAPKVLVSHGPPATGAKTGIDVAHDAGNVGDPGMAELLKDASIPFGLFGHILEAGGRGSDLSGKALAPKKWHPTLYVNAGSGNPDPWKMLDGKPSYGMALYVEIKGKAAQYQVERLAQAAPKPEATTD